jgi:hypothetical protein
MQKYLVTSSIATSWEPATDVASIIEEPELALDWMLTHLRRFGCVVISAGLHHDRRGFTEDLRIFHGQDLDYWHYPAYIYLETREKPEKVIQQIIEQLPGTRWAVWDTKVIPMH